MGWFTNALGKVKGWVGDRVDDVKEVAGKVVDTGKDVGKFIGKTAGDVYHDVLDRVDKVVDLPNKFLTPFMIIGGVLVAGVAIWALNNDIPNRVLKSKGI